ncbi:MAG: gluconolactonase [Paraburkholderia sp.]|jgi:gluconolactonase|nr:gluconolactonase [Paraburkholderia sp.]
MWQQSETYPDPAVEVLDPRFLKYRMTNAAVERLATGMRFGEGPVWFGDGRFLLQSLYALYVDTTAAAAT